MTDTVMRVKNEKKWTPKFTICLIHQRGLTQGLLLCFSTCSGSSQGKEFFSVADASLMKCTV